jgi:divalent metal cation (Fe/Co/Zn/Cd) transporter
VHTADFTRALLVSLLSAAWTLVAGSLAIAVGVRDGSGVLVALGAIGLLDAAASVILAEHFAHARRHERASDRREQIAHRAVTVGLMCVGLATAAVSIWRLAANESGHASGASVVLAGASFVALIGLARWKRSLALCVRSRALLGDSRLSLIGAAQSAIAVAGTITTEELHWGWADPAAALGVGIVALAVGAITLPRRSRL